MDWIRTSLFNLFQVQSSVNVNRMESVERGMFSDMPLCYMSQVSFFVETAPFFTKPIA